MLFVFNMIYLCYKRNGTKRKHVLRKAYNEKDHDIMKAFVEEVSSVSDDNEYVYANENIIVSNQPMPTEAQVIHQSSISERETLWEVLRAEGLETYLTSTIGGSLAHKPLKTMFVRIIDLLLWTYSRYYNKCLNPDDAISWLEELITKQFRLMVPYIQHLECNKKPSTIAHTLVDIKKVAVWCFSFRETATEYFEFGPFFHVCYCCMIQM